MKKTEIEKAEESFEKGNKFLRFRARDYDYIPSSRHLKALKRFEEAVKLDPNHHAAWLSLSYSSEEYATDEEEVFFFEKALEAAAKAVELNANDEHSWRQLSGLLDQLLDARKKRGSSTEFLEETAEELYPDLKTLQEELLNCYTQMISLEKNPDTTLSLKASLLQELGRDDEYIKACYQILKLKPKDAYSYLRIYWIHRDKPDYEKALEFFEKYEKYEHNIKAYELAEKAEILEKLGKNEKAKETYSKALALINESIESDPEYLFYYLVKAGILEKLGRYKEALECCEKIFQPSKYIRNEKDKARLQNDYNERIESIKKHRS